MNTTNRNSIFAIATRKINEVLIPKSNCSTMYCKTGFKLIVIQFHIPFYTQCPPCCEVIHYNPFDIKIEHTPNIHGNRTILFSPDSRMLSDFTLDMCRLL